MLLQRVEYIHGKWMVDVSLHCNNLTFYREGGNPVWTSSIWNDEDEDVYMWEDWLEELFQSYLENLRK